jgi:hypothetical protein
VSDVEQAIEDRAILRTWPMRGTIHLVPAVDAHWMLQLGAARKLAGRPATHGAARARRRGRRPKRRPAARRDARTRPGAAHRADGVAGARGDPDDGQRGYHLLWRLAQTGLVCLGPVRGKQQTFVLLDEWVPDPRRLARDEALTELAGRYFRSRGPATVHDFATWAGLTVADARAGLEAVRPSLACAASTGVDHWLAAETGLGRHVERPPAARLRRVPPRLQGPQRRSRRDTCGQVVPGRQRGVLPGRRRGSPCRGHLEAAHGEGPGRCRASPFDDDTGELAEHVGPAVRAYARFLGLPVAPAWA